MYISDKFNFEKLIHMNMIILIFYFFVEFLNFCLFTPLDNKIRNKSVVIGIWREQFGMK
jgi:hypothetical protein